MCGIEKKETFYKDCAIILALHTACVGMRNRLCFLAVQRIRPHALGGTILMFNKVILPSLGHNKGVRVMVWALAIELLDLNMMPW